MIRSGSGSISDDRLLDVAQEFIGPNIALFASHYLCKPAGAGLPGALASGRQLLATRADGGGDAVAGGGRFDSGKRLYARDPRYAAPRIAEIAGAEGHCQRPRVRDRSKFVDESKAVDVILKAGDVSVHHPNVIHGSNANTSTKRRCGLTDPVHSHNHAHHPDAVAV